MISLIDWLFIVCLVVAAFTSRKSEKRWIRWLWLVALVLGLSIRLYRMRSAHKHGERLSEVARDQQESARLATVAHLGTRAENGDRAALLQLFALAPDATASRLDFGPVSIARKNIDRITHKFNSMSLEDPVFQHQLSGSASHLVDQDSLAAHLHHTNYLVRSQAAFNASFLRINRLIPELYETARTEPDLHALNVMCYSLNQLLAPDRKPFFTSQFVLHPDWASNTFHRLWLPAKDALLGQSPKKWIHVEPKEGRPWNTMLIDPDTQDEVTGEPKQR